MQRWLKLWDKQCSLALLSAVVEAHGKPAGCVDPDLSVESPLFEVQLWRVQIAETGKCVITADILLLRERTSRKNKQQCCNQ